MADGSHGERAVVSLTDNRRLVYVEYSVVEGGNDSDVCVSVE